jgi:hypothetical protein
VTIALTTHSLLIIAAILCFVLAALPGIKTGLNLTAVGLACLAASFLIA